MVRSRIADGFAIAAAAVAALLLLVRWTGWPGVSPLVQIVAFPQLLWLALLLAAVASTVSHVRSLRWWLLAMTLAASWPLLPSASGPADASQELTVVSSNVLRGTATEGALALARAEDADVLFLIECDLRCAGLLEAPDTKAAFPFRVVSPGRHANGAAILSRYPLSMAALDLKTTGFSESAQAVLNLPGGTQALLKLAHPHPPLPAALAEWRDELDQLAAIAESTVGVPLIMAGDFNAAAEHREFRDIVISGGLVDLGRVGGTLGGTWPVKWPVWAGTEIDHILARGFAVDAVDSIEIPIADHRALVARLRY